MMYYGTEMNALNFGVKRSQLKVITYAGTLTVQVEAMACSTRRPVCRVRLSSVAFSV